MVFVDLCAVFHQLSAVVGGDRVEEEAGFDAGNHQLDLYTGSSGSLERVHDGGVRDEVRALDADFVLGASDHAQIAHLDRFLVGVHAADDELAQLRGEGFLHLRQRIDILHRFLPVLAAHRAQPVGQEIFIQHMTAPAGHADLGVPPRIFDLGKVGILLADVHAADVGDAVVDDHDLAVAAVVGEEGLDADDLAACLTKRTEHTGRGGKVGDKIAHHQHLDPLLCLFAEGFDQRFAHQVVVDGVKFDVDALLGVLDVRKQLAVVPFSVGIDLHVVAAGQTAAVVALVKLDDLAVLVGYGKLGEDSLLRDGEVMLVQTFFAQVGGQLDCHGAAEHQIQHRAQVRQADQDHHPQQRFGRLFALQKDDTENHQQIDEKQNPFHSRTSQLQLLVGRRADVDADHLAVGADAHRHGEEAGAGADDGGGVTAAGNSPQLLFAV